MPLPTNRGPETDRKNEPMNTEAQQPNQNDFAPTMYAIGQPWPGPMQAGPHYNYTADGQQMVIPFAKPTQKEMGSVSGGPVRITFTREGALLFLVVDFGDGFIIDGSYYWWLNVGGH